MPEKELKLKVIEALPDDVNKGIVKIDSDILPRIGARLGDVVKIKGGRETVAIVERGYPGDKGLNLIRMDGITRRNAETGIGEVVSVSKADVKEAKEVIISPASKGLVVNAPSHIFKQGLMGKAVTKGDIVSLGYSSQRRKSEELDDIYDMISKSMMGFGLGSIKFVVADANPKGSVVISELTEVVFNPEAVEVKEEKILEVTYDDIGGLKDEIDKVREMVELPLKHPEIFERLGIEPPKGVLLHGSPGTGKTLLAKAVANETNSHFILINGPEIMSKFYGESEGNLRKKFEEAEKNAPSIIFIDEIDAIAPKREESRGEVERRVVAQLLALMDGLNARGKVVVIAATNIPNAIDIALRRPGRFDREIEIGIPSKEGRQDILKIHTRNMPLEGEIYSNIFKEKLFEEIEKQKADNLEELNDLKDELSNNSEELNDLKRGLEKLNLESKKSEESYLQIVLNKIKGLRNKKVLLEEEINSKQNRKRLVEEKIKSTKLVEDELNKKKTFVSKIANKLRKLETNKTIYNFDDIRAKLIESYQSKEEENLITQILDLDILTPKLLDSIRREGAVRDLKEIAGITHGFVGADLAALSKEAAMIVVRRLLPELKIKEDNTISKEILEKLKITKKDFNSALRVVRPSALREVLVEVPDVKWEDIGGLENIKQELEEAVEWPLKNPDSFRKLGVKPPRGVLIYGAPGTGKTLLAKAVANESDSNFILVKGPEMLSKWVGESEKAVREVFKKARQTAPTIIFFDEIDSIAPRRGISSDSHVTERVVNQLLTEIDGLEDLNDVVVIAATNRPDMIDNALLRPGRFDRVILTPAPDKKTREQIFRVHTRGMPLKDDVNIEELAEKTEGYVGADIESVCREAAIFSLRKDIKATKIGMESFENALDKVRPSITKEIQDAYENIRNHFKSARAKEMKQEKPSYMG
jgi:transitional endoplasmic reticulum ATPase